jgi:hypothetical protein
MIAVVFHGIDEVRFEDVDQPRSAQRTDAIIPLAASAICGTDLHIELVRTGACDASESKVDPMHGALHAYQAFDERQLSSIKTELIPQIEC